MKILIRGRRYGKTDEAVKWVMKTEGAVLLTINEIERSRVLARYEDLKEEQVTTFYRAKNGELRGRHVNTFAIDNLDIILTQMFGCDIGLITMSGGEVEASPSA